MQVVFVDAAGLVRVFGSPCYSKISGNNFLKMPDQNDHIIFLKTQVIVWGDKFGEALNFLAASVASERMNFSFL